MAIKIYGAYRTDTNLGDDAVTFATAGTTFQIGSYGSLTMTDGADPTIIDGDNVVNESPNDPTQTLNGDVIIWDYTIEVTDGVNTYQIGVVDYDLDGSGSFDFPSSEQGYFLAFIGDVPPLNTDLTIGAVIDNGPNIDVDTVVPCFVAGTLIDTPDGPRAIERLRRGDAVLTRDRGPQIVQWIGSRTLGPDDMARKPRLRPIRIAAGALGRNLPRRDLLVSPQHRVLMHSPIARRMFEAEEILVPAHKLAGLPGISVEPGDRAVTYHHLLFRRHEIVISEGAATESLYFGPEAARAVGAAAYREILDLFPELAASGSRPATARKVPEKGRSIDRFLQRHAKNRKPLVMSD